ncbi:MAG: hypothetical protein Q9192_005610 [Flavoplaca navasiana]
MSNTDFLGRAIDVVKRAIEDDKAGEYEKAYQLYYQALELFMLALKWEKNANSKTMIRTKASEYMERAEKLKNHLAEADKGNKKKPAAVGSNGKVSGGGGKGKDDDDEEADPDAKKLRGALQGAILTDKPNIKWEDVAGLEQAKEALKEAVILPIKFPHLFVGKRQPWKGILLYGPPGTGKSYLAKAVATEANSTFFSVSSSDLVSKWMGESERLVKQLFSMARENKPSIIFIDEVDALCGPRGEGESEASRRIKTELLVQMDGVGRDSKGVLILGATNIPWQLDAAIRRRFQRRVHISLPDLPGRMKMFELAVGTTPCDLKAADFKTLGQLSEGYSGSDIAIAVQDALMQPVRKIQTATHYKPIAVEAEGGQMMEKLTPCSPGDKGALEMNWTDVDSEKLLEPPLVLKDFVKAVKGARPTVSQEDIKRSAEWTAEFGSEAMALKGIIEEVGLTSEPASIHRFDNGRNRSASVHNERTSTITVSTPPISSEVDDNVHANNGFAVVELEDDTVAAGSTDLWSAAYREAVSSFGEEVKSVILKGERIEKLFSSLEETNGKVAGDSLFRRGVQRLGAPLRNFKLALDMASPFTSIEPTASTAVGVVSSVTAIAIAICGAEEALNAQIVTMLEHVAIIDECDILGQKLEAGNKIHKALVPVYKDLLDFYIAARKILTNKAFVFALVCEQLRQHLPTIVSGFLEHAVSLKSRIANATLELVADIKKLLQDNKIQKLLGVNKDKQRSELHCELRELRASDACKWIVVDSKFLAWYNAATSERMVIFGNMGCGKTIITAHVIEELIHLNNYRLPRALICYHYCVDNETGKLLYIYSSLILQLLDQQEGLKVEFDKWYDNARESKLLNPVQSSVDLGNFFSICVETLSRELFIVIDGLDECDSGSQKELVTLLDSLSKKTSRLKVFFSSRPQEGIQSLLQGSTEIRWVPTRERDAIIVRHTVKRCLGEFPITIQSLVTERLSESAQGSAIWVKLTVKLIQKRKIQAIGPMKTFLADIPAPAALSQLYGSLFAHLVGDDLDNEQLASNALEILAVARRPLSILELGWAIALKDPCTGVPTVKALEDYVDEKRALSLLQPFLSQIDFQDIKKNQVKLVHHSLKELILRESPPNWAQSHNIGDKRRVRKRQPELEAAMLHVCVKYLLLDDFNQNDLFSEEGVTAQRLQELPGFGVFDDDDDKDDDDQQLDSPKKSSDLEKKQEAKQLYYDPSERGFGEFFVYASCFWVDHFKVSAPEFLPDTSDIVTLCRAKSRRLRNWIGQYCRPDCTIMPKFDLNSDFLDPLVIVSLYGSEIALKKLLQDHDVGSKEFLIDSVKETIRQIIRRGDISRLRILFRDTQVGPRVRSFGFFCQIMELWHSDNDRESSEWVGLFDLVVDIFDLLIRKEWGNEFLCTAVSYGCLPIAERLFEEAAHNPAMRNELLRVDCNRSEHHQSIGEAVWNNHVGVLRYLLQQDGIEVHLRHQDSGGYNVLHKAARYCNPLVVSLLVSHFREGVNQTNNVGDTPLIEVVFKSGSAVGRIESAKILLIQGGADVRAGYTDDPSNWHEPLRMAARYGDVAMCRILVEVGGADPRRVLRIGDDGRPSLMDPGAFEELASEVLDTLCSLAGMSP